MSDPTANQWTCPACGAGNSADFTACARCGRHVPIQPGDRKEQATWADRFAVVGASLNVGAIVATIIAGFVEQRADDLSELLLMAGLLANVVAPLAWLIAGVSQWPRGRGLAVAYVVFGGGFSLLMHGFLVVFFMW